MSEPKIRLGQVTALETRLDTIYTQANNAYSTANTATTTGGGGYDQANNAYTQANSAYSQANASYGQANASYGQANSAYTQANSAYTQANSSYGQANSAYGQANSAYGAANTAQSTAQDAYLQANTATTNAGNAHNQANSAYLQANNAYTAANNSNLKLGGVITGTLNVTQDIIVGGNVYLEGNTTFINVATYSIEDSLIYLASNNSLTDSVDIGFIGGKNTSGIFSHTGLARDATDGKYKLFDGLPDNDHVGNVVNFANTTLATLVANVEANSILLSGNAVATNVSVNAAYSQANAAYGQANLAYTQANSAYSQANSSYGAANNRVLKAGDTMTGQLNISSGGLLVTGNVGIGTASPSDRFVVENAAANVVARISAGGSASYTASLAMGTVTRDWTLTAGNGTGSYSFSLNYVGTDSPVSNILVALKTGNVGIGTSSPAYKLDVNGTANFDSNVTLSGGAANGVAYLNGSKVLSSGSGLVFDGTNLGIGVSPSYRLDILGAGAAAALRINNATAGKSAMLVQSNGSTAGIFGLTGFIKGDSSTNVGILAETGFDLRFYTNGSATERVVIDTSGNLGLGVTPSAWQSASGLAWKAFDIGGAGSLAFSPAGSNDLTLAINSYYDSTDSRWEYKSTGDKAARYSITAAGVHQWYTTNSTGTANNPITFGDAKMTLTAAGDVGIGTTSPSNKLDVNGTSIFRDTLNFGSGALISWTSGYSDGTTQTFQSPSSGSLVFIANGAVGLFINSSQNVGIGTTSPSYKLDVYTSTTNTGAQLRIKNAYASVSANATVNIDGYGGSELKIWRNGLEEWKLERVSSTDDLQLNAYGGAVSGGAGAGVVQFWDYDTGNIGIGTTSPNNTRLHIRGDWVSGHSTVKIQTITSFASSGTAGIGVYDSDGTRAGYFYGNSSGTYVGSTSNTAFVLEQFGAEKMRIHTNGNVGIGTTSPSYKLHIRLPTTTSDVVQRWESPSYDSVDLYVGSSVAYFGTVSTTPLTFRTNNTERVRIDGSGNLVGIGTTSLTANGGIVQVGQVPNATSSSIGFNNGDNAVISARYSLVFQINSDNNQSGRVFNWKAGGKGYSDGTDLMILSAAGNLGIGTTSPASKLSVRGTTDLGDSHDSTTSSLHTTRLSGYALRYDASSRYGNYGVLIFSASHGWTSSAKRFMITNGIDANKFCIIRSVDGLTDPTLGDAGSITSGTADFTISHTGNIGIGESTPSFKLDLKGAGGSNGEAYRNVLIFDTNTAAAGVGGGIAFGGYYSGTSSLINDFAGIQGFKENGTAGDYAGALKFTTRTNGNTPTERMRITSGGNVGIGTTSPAALLHIERSTVSYGQVRLKSTSSNAGETSIHYGRTEQTLEQGWTVGQGTASSGDSFCFYTGGANRVIINTSGHVTVPNQPAFKAGRSTSVGIGANEVIVFNSEDFDTTNSYNASTGRFTAPTAGKYFFSTLVIYESVTDGAAFDDGFSIMKNGSRITYSFRRAEYVAGTTGNGGYYTDWANILVDLAVNDYVEVINLRASLTLHGNSLFNWFCGYKVS